MVDEKSLDEKALDRKQNKGKLGSWMAKKNGEALALQIRHNQWPLLSQCRPILHQRPYRGQLACVEECVFTIDGYPGRFDGEGRIRHPNMGGQAVTGKADTYIIRHEFHWGPQKVVRKYRPISEFRKIGGGVYNNAVGVELKVSPLNTSIFCLRLTSVG